MKEYISIVWKSFYYFVIVSILISIGFFLNIKYIEYTANKTIISDYLISKNKITELSVVGYKINPNLITLKTEDGYYHVKSNDRFKTLESVTTLSGEDFTTRKKVVKDLKKYKVNNVKKGSLNYKGKGIYEAYDFDTKHTYVIQYNEDKDDLTVEYKEID